MTPQIYDGISNPIISTNCVGMFFINTSGLFTCSSGTNWITLSHNAISNSTNFIQIIIHLRYHSYLYDFYSYRSNSLIVAKHNLSFNDTSSLYFRGFDIYQGAGTSYVDNVSISNWPIIKLNNISITSIDKINSINIDKVHQINSIDY
jgi:hypothetical protein